MQVGLSGIKTHPPPPAFGLFVLSKESFKRVSCFETCLKTINSSTRLPSIDHSCIEAALPHLSTDSAHGVLKKQLSKRSSGKDSWQKANCSDLIAVDCDWLWRKARPNIEVILHFLFSTGIPLCPASCATPTACAGRLSDKIYTAGKAPPGNLRPSWSTYAHVRVHPTSPKHKLQNEKNKQTKAETHIGLDITSKPLNSESKQYCFGSLRQYHTNFPSLQLIAVPLPSYLAWGTREMVKKVSLLPSSCDLSQQKRNES